MAINLTKANSNTLTIKNTYRRALSLKFHVLNFKPNKGNLAFKSTQLKSVRAIKNQVIEITQGVFNVNLL